MHMLLDALMSTGNGLPLPNLLPDPIDDFVINIVFKIAYASWTRELGWHDPRRAPHRSVSLPSDQVFLPRITKDLEYPFQKARIGCLGEICACRSQRG